MVFCYRDNDKGFMIGNLLKEISYNSLSMKFSNLKILLNLLLLIAVVLIITDCANPIPPKGGPRDITPPQVLYCVPANYSSGFTTD
ncbi:MAG: hypothetical protein KAT33_05265, partial [Bacteroidales bacterium]|nr:hypothetical protein [Bacteroidales bacterium]